MAAMFASLGAKVLDADKIAHQLILPGSPCFKRIVRVFGKGILTKGAIDRVKLGRLVFRAPKRLKKLEKIIHPEVIKEIRRRIAKARVQKVPAVVLDVPLLFESQLNKDTDAAITVRANLAAQLTRIQKKRPVTRAEFFRRIRVQLPLKQKAALSDFIIDNRGTLSATRKQVRDIWNKIAVRCPSRHQKKI